MNMEIIATAASEAVVNITLAAIALAAAYQKADGIHLGLCK